MNHFQKKSNSLHVTPSGQPTVRVANTTGMMPPIHKQLNFPNLKGTTDTTHFSSEPNKSQGYAAHGHHNSMGNGGTAGTGTIRATTACSRGEL